MEKYLSLFSLKTLVFGLEISIIFFAAAFLSTVLQPVPTDYIDFFANIGLRVVVLTVMVSFAHDLAVRLQDKLQK